LDDLAQGWNQIDTGEATSCARGGKYSFFVRKTESKDLLIYFEGGGNCYDAKTCRVGSDTFDDSIDPAFEADNPGLKSAGIFNLNDERNPFRDYSMVFISYCTGDAFLGDRTIRYNDAGNEFQVNHVGYRNAQSVFQWIYQNYTRPESIFMIGCSAGVTGSYFNAPYLLQHYPDTPTALIGDSGGGYLSGSAAYARNFGTLDLFPNWIPAYQQVVSGDVFQTRYLFTIPAVTFPDVPFGLIDTQQDHVQEKILQSFAPRQTLAAILKTNTAEIQAETKNLYSYTGPGDYHCITMAPEYYTYAVSGVSLNDWVKSFQSKQGLKSVGP
jgi:hypothetical protein